jgi:hypothetical protein
MPISLEDFIAELEDAAEEQSATIAQQAAIIAQQAGASPSSRLTESAMCDLSVMLGDGIPCKIPTDTGPTRETKC